LIFIAEDAQGCVEKYVLICEDECVERVEVAVLGIFDESGFVHADILSWAME